MPAGQPGPKAGTSPALTIAIAKKPGSNASDITAAIASRIQTLRGELIPGAVQVEIVRDYGATATDKAQKLIQKLDVRHAICRFARVLFTLGSA